MGTLSKLQAAKGLADLAKLLGYNPKGLSYVIYVLNDAAKYTTFDIPKRTGGRRIIKAPTPYLRLLQARLANLLNQCIREIKAEKPRFLHDRTALNKTRQLYRMRDST